MSIFNPIASAGSLVLLETKTLAGGANVDFTAITYYKRYLIFMSITPSGAGAQLQMTFNADGGANYACERILAAGAALAAVAAVNQTSGEVAAALDSGDVNGLRIEIDNSIAGRVKVYQAQYTQPTARIGIYGGKWANTVDLISRITLTPNAGNVGTGFASLYGVVT